MAQDTLTQTVDIETPELVVLSYTIAGLGSRVYAGLIDLFICAAALIAFLIGIVALAGHSKESLAQSSPSTAWAVAVIILFQFAILWGYYLLFEGFNDGQTPGKRLLRLRAVRDGGYSIGFSASAVRNLMRIVDLQPAFTYAIGIGSVLVSKSGKRLGDIVAGTIVVRESLVRQPMQSAAPAPSSAVVTAPLSAQLSDDEFRLLERWAERRNSLEPQRRRELTAQVAARLRRTLPVGDPQPTGAFTADQQPTNISYQNEAAALARLVETERRARASGLAARGAKGASRERYAIVTSNSPRWIAFAARLAEAQRRGLRALGEPGVRDFVAEYRSLTADLARLQTATRGEASNEVFYLGRLVAGAHNLLYRDRRGGIRAVLRFIAIDVPSEVRRSVAPIALAAACLFGPAAIAYTAVVRDPNIAPTFIPTGMLDRAEAGVERAKGGDGYIEDPQVFRPVMASSIIANNVQVTIAAFAFGVTAGIGTLLLLLFNGVSLGGIFGLYASKGILSLLLAFVAPHGVLELSAICIAGSAGFLIAGAMLVPGRRTRRRALAENSARAMRLIAASTLMLIFAGSLEGMVSPIPYWPLSLKLIVSSMTLVLLVAYLRGGAGRAPAALPREEAGLAILPSEAQLSS